MTCYDGNCKNCRRCSVCKSNTNLQKPEMKEYSSPMFGIEIKLVE
jgi:predicted metal-binding protein